MNAVNIWVNIYPTSLRSPHEQTASGISLLRVESRQRQEKVIGIDRAVPPLDVRGCSRCTTSAVKRIHDAFDPTLFSSTPPGRHHGRLVAMQ